MSLPLGMPWIKLDSDMGGEGTRIMALSLLYQLYASRSASPSLVMLTADRPHRAVCIDKQKAKTILIFPYVSELREASGESKSSLRVRFQLGEMESAFDFYPADFEPSGSKVTEFPGSKVTGESQSVDAGSGESSSRTTGQVPSAVAKARRVHSKQPEEGLKAKEGGDVVPSASDVGEDSPDAQPEFKNLFWEVLANDRLGSKEELPASGELGLVYTEVTVPCASFYTIKEPSYIRTAGGKKSAERLTLRVPCLVNHHDVARGDALWMRCML